METELQGTNKGIFTLTAADLETIGELERARRNYSLTLDEMDEGTRIEKLKSLLNDMGEYMEANGFREYLKKKFVEEYTFYDVEDLLEDTDGDPDLIRRGCRIAFPIWKEATQQLGVGLPTFRIKHGTQRKMATSLYSLVLSKISVDDMVRKFEAVDGIHHKSNLNKLCFTISGMRDHDIDFNGIIAGRARVGKSSLTAWMVELIYGLRGENIYRIMPDGRPWYEHFMDQRLIFEPGHGQEALKSADGDINWFDESYFTLDRRRSMSKKNIDLTRDWNAYASKKSVNLSLIQNFSDMDLRGTSKAVMTMLLIERGYGMIFSDARWIPLVRDQFGFEQLMEHPDQMKDKEVAIHMLQSRREYVCDFTWRDRGAYENAGVIYGAERDPFYAYYLSKKLEFQATPSGKEAKELQKEANEKHRQMMNNRKAIHQMFYKNPGIKAVEVARRLGMSQAYVHSIRSGAI